MTCRWTTTYKDLASKGAAPSKPGEFLKDADFLGSSTDPLNLLLQEEEAQVSILLKFPW